MLRVGLTGGIGTGKTTVANMFKGLGVSVFNADDIVHSNMQKLKIIKKIQQNFPLAIANGQIDRNILRSITLNDLSKLKILEGLLHPLVNKALKRFLVKQFIKNPFKIVILDIPLLFECKYENLCDLIIVVTCSEEEQLKRVLQRGRITVDEFKKFQSLQMPMPEKLKKADFVIDTEKSLEETTKQVKKLFLTLKKHKKQNIL